MKPWHGTFKECIFFIVTHTVSLKVPEFSRHSDLSVHGHISPDFCRRGNAMEVIDECTVSEVLSWYPSSQFTVNRQEYFSFHGFPFRVFSKKKTRLLPYKENRSYLKFLELSLSTISRSLSWVWVLYSNSTHDKPALYSSQLIVIIDRGGPEIK
jgi:hypothetical protein